MVWEREAQWLPILDLFTFAFDTPDVFTVFGLLAEVGRCRGIRHQSPGHADQYVLDLANFPCLPLDPIAEVPVGAVVACEPLIVPTGLLVQLAGHEPGVRMWLVLVHCRR